MTRDRSHFDQRAWIAYLREDKIAQEWFAKGVVFCNDTSTDVNGALRSLLSEHVREHVIDGVSENDPKEVLTFRRFIAHLFFGGDDARILCMCVCVCIYIYIYIHTYMDGL